jgi:hypothetical protein
MPVLPNSVIPVAMPEKVRELGRIWAASELRPRLNAEIKNHWDSLIQAWAGSDLPLAVRKSGRIRGGISNHLSGRKIVLTDNSPAQWAFSRAFSGLKYSIDDIRELFQRDEIPFAYATKRSEKDKMVFKCTLRDRDNVNKYGWKLCHIDDVGLSTSTRPEQLPLDTLIRHFCLLLMPSNHFLVPLTWAGFGELPEIIDEIRKFEERPNHLAR